ncbi:MULTISPECIES: AAA family ATPase [Flavobacteriaceae]|uniref:AAA family ATPase n=1 Tax=Flavobacteriaceae TaxID=49546 RepID=UPI00064AD324|nr:MULTISPECIES: AAA family ATPase [Flavobacteriaceae]
MTLQEVTDNFISAKENIYLVYAFNGTGKTRLSVNLKDSLKLKDGSHQGVYFNAYSEDLFVWDNDKIELNIIQSSISDYHQYMGTEVDVHNKLKYYDISFDFRFNLVQDDNPELGWKSVSFFRPDDEEANIKISRGEEKIFIWCWFLTLFEVNELVESQDKYIFIDDPVSSLDDNNIFNTARLLLDLFKEKVDGTKIVLTTHHAGLFSILTSWLRKGDNAAIFKTKDEKGNEINKFIARILEKKDEDYKLKSTKKGSFFYHLVLVDILKEAVASDDLDFQHFAFLRQLLETISSFLGKPRFSYALEKLEVSEPSTKTDIINARSHEFYNQKASFLDGPDKQVIIDVMDAIDSKFKFA